MPKDTLAKAAARLSRRLDQLSRVSDERGATTRTFLSPAMHRANVLVGGWMSGAGLTVREDRVSNLIGRLEARRRGAKTLILGSHLDTVRDAGRFDGTLGVLLPIAAVELIRDLGIVLPFAVEVLGFSEEEGVRFSSAYIGSKGYAGRLTKADLRLRDASGVSLIEVLATLEGRRFTPPRPAHARDELLGYLEVHIEQGPVLEAKGRAVGIVSGIAGQTRGRVVFTGGAGHAGTTPMALRRDALAGAAEFILAMEAYARARAPLVATVGMISARPGAANVIPASAVMSLDVRHPVEARRFAALAQLKKLGRAIARRRGLSFSVEVTQDNPSVACSQELSSLLARSVRRHQGDAPALASGAGHDAVIMASMAPVAMLFVRCKEGLSHHRDEFVHPRDLAAALRVVVDFIVRLASQSES